MKTHRIRISVDDENCLGFDVEHEPETNEDWIKILENLVESLKASVPEDKELV